MARFLTRAAAAVLLLGSGLAAAGCGSAGPAYYLASNSSQVLLATWNTPQNGSASGEITYDSIDTAGSDSSAPDSLSVDNAPVTVTISGNQVTFSAFLGTTITGTLGSGMLSITNPPDTSTGQITTDTLSTSSATAYNAAVRRLDQTIAVDNDQALAAQQAQQHQQANTAAENTASTDLATLEQVSFASDLSQLGTDVQQEGTDLGTVKSDAAAGQGSFCGNVDTVAGDADTVDGDSDTVQGDIGTLTSDIATARSDVAAVSNDLASLNTSGLPLPVGASAAVTAARRAIRAAISQADADIGQANADAADAYQVASSLATGSCSGSGPESPPAPLPDI